MFLNMKYKTQRISQNTRNSDFLKNREIRQFAFNIHISNAIRPILLSLRVLIYKTFDHNHHRPFHYTKIIIGKSPFVRPFFLFP